MASDRDTLADIIAADVDRQVKVHGSYISHLDEHELADSVTSKQLLGSGAVTVVFHPTEEPTDA